MNKTERIADLNSRVVKVLVEHAPTTLNDGDKEYSYTCLIKTDSGFSEESYSIRVVTEGDELNEVADYVRKSPPRLISREAMLKQRLGYLKTMGDVKLLDISQLGIPFAKIKIGTTVKFIAELDGDLLVEDGE